MTLDYRVRNQRVISSNIANIDTPGYRPKQLKFDEELRRAVDGEELRLRKTDRKHLPGPQEFASGGQPSCVEENPAESIAGDVSLDIDREMTKMAKNNLLYEATVKMLSRKFDLLRTAIEEKR
jgi:flagellar basal-body rod protein FlgB